MSGQVVAGIVIGVVLTLAAQTLLLLLVDIREENRRARHRDVRAARRVNGTEITGGSTVRRIYASGSDPDQ